MESIVSFYFPPRFTPSLIVSFIVYTCRRGARPEVHQDAASGIIRTIMRSFDDLKLLEHTEKGGRKISRTGQQALDLVASQVAYDEL